MTSSSTTFNRESYHEYGPGKSGHKSEHAEPDYATKSAPKKWKIVRLAESFKKKVGHSTTINTAQIAMDRLKANVADRNPFANRVKPANRRFTYINPLSNQASTVRKVIAIAGLALIGGGALTANPLAVGVGVAFLAGSAVVRGLSPSQVKLKKKAVDLQAQVTNLQIKTDELVSKGKTSRYQAKDAAKIIGQIKNSFNPQLSRLQNRMAQLEQSMQESQLELKKLTSKKSALEEEKEKGSDKSVELKLKRVDAAIARLQPSLEEDREKLNSIKKEQSQLLTLSNKIRTDAEVVIFKNKRGIELVNDYEKELKHFAKTMAPLTKLAKSVQAAQKQKAMRKLKTHELELMKENLVQFIVKVKPQAELTVLRYEKMKPLNSSNTGMKDFDLLKRKINKSVEDVKNKFKFILNYSDNISE